MLIKLTEGPILPIEKDLCVRHEVQTHITIEAFASNQVHDVAAWVWLDSKEEPASAVQVSLVQVSLVHVFLVLLAGVFWGVKEDL